MTSRKHINGVPLYEIAHENSKNTVRDDSDDSVYPDSWVEIDYKQYGAAERVPFDAQPTEPSHLESVLARRQSPSQLEPQPLSTDTLDTLICGAAGITRRGAEPDMHRRAYPSGGARYPLELYVFLREGADLPRGVYHYDVLDNALEAIAVDPPSDSLSFVWGDADTNASAVVFITARFARSTTKYGSRGYRYAHIEAGHLMQNLSLLATDEGLACRPYGGFIEDAADEFLNLGDAETTIYLGLLGAPVQEESQ